MDELARKLGRAIINKGWTPAEAARQAGIPPDRMLDLVRGEDLPTAEEAQALAATLGLEPASLMTPPKP